MGLLVRLSPVIETRAVHPDRVHLGRLALFNKRSLFMANHALETIRTMATGPVTGTKAAALDHAQRIATLDDKMVGSTMANEVLATIQSHHGTVWKNYAVRLMSMTAEAREAFIEALRNQVKGWKTANTLDGSVDKKIAAKRVNTAVQYATKLANIATAWDNGATIDGLLGYATQPGYERPTIDEVGFTIVCEYADTMRKKSNKGRPSHDLLTKFGKWLDSAEAKSDLDATIRTELVATYNAMVERFEKASAALM